MPDAKQPPTLTAVDLAALRDDYRGQPLLRKDLEAEPLTLLGKWLEQAIAAAAPEPTAMVLATVDGSGRPSARVVLLKGLEERGLVFYTNYESRKGAELAANPNAAVCFFWQPLSRQVRLAGKVRKVSRRQTEEYFGSRPRGSRIGAWSSAQSRPIDNRQRLEVQIAEVEERFADRPIAPPPFWGGYLLVPDEVEFWQGRSNRLHDRFRYSAAGRGTGWSIERLAP